MFVDGSDGADRDSSSTLMESSTGVSWLDTTVWRAALLAAIVSALGAGTAGFLAGHNIGTVSTKREEAACLGVELSDAHTPAEVKAVLENCFPGDDLEIVRTRLSAKIDELTGNAGQ